MPKTDFGDTVPYFYIAKEFGVDYGDVLKLADMVTHSRVYHDMGDVLHKLPNAVHGAVWEQVWRFREIRDGASY
jgi:hypothetical protein